MTSDEPRASGELRASDEPGAHRDGAAGVVEDLGAFIRERREAAELSLRRLAHRAGVSNPYLSQIERGLRRPSAEILQAIAKGLEISSESLYVRAGILEDRDAAAVRDVEQAVGGDPHLTRAQRAALLELYRSFLRANAATDGPRADVPDGGDVDTDPGAAGEAGA